MDNNNPLCAVDDHPAAWRAGAEAALNMVLEQIGITHLEAIESIRQQVVEIAVAGGTGSG